MQQDDGRRWYVLAKPHTHGGREYPAGAKVKLLADQAEWLEGLGVVSGPAKDETTAKAKG